MQLLGTWLVAFQAIRLDGGRNLIGRRTESDWTADGIRSGGGVPSRGCTCLKCTNRAILMLLLVGVALAWLVGALLTWLVGALLALASGKAERRQVHQPEESVEK